ncbi:MAG TPA: response regulator transcription factor [Chryseosolibacter sp.]
MNIVIVDDHKLFRIGLREILKKSRSHKVVAEFSTGQEMLEAYNDANDHLALIDIDLEGENGIEVSRALKGKFNLLKTALLSMHKDVAIIRYAISTGVDGYFHKDIDQEELLFGIGRIQEGGRYYTSEVTELLLSHGDFPGNDYVPLTDREKQVIQLIVDGYSSIEIADKMKISKRTVDNHRANILMKFKFKNTAQLIRFIVKKGIL